MWRGSRVHVAGRRAGAGGFRGKWASCDAFSSNDQKDTGATEQDVNGQIRTMLDVCPVVPFTPPGDTMMLLSGQKLSNASGSPVHLEPPLPLARFGGFAFIRR